MEYYRINGVALRWLRVYYMYGYSLHQTIIYDQTSSTPVLGWEEHVCVVVCVSYMCELVLVC